MKFVVFLCILWLWCYWVCSAPTNTDAYDSPSIIAFDCHDPKSSIWTVSLLATPECIIPEEPTESKNVVIQLLQASRFKKIPIYQCYVRRVVFIKGCGKLFDYTWEIPGGYEDSILPLDPELCARFHRTRFFEFQGMTIHALAMNNTVNSYRVAAGSNNDDGDCVGGDYTLRGKVFQSVVVTEYYTVGLYTGYGLVDLDANLIELPSGTSASFRAGEMIDISKGYTFWSTAEPKDCNDWKYDVLYQGPALKSGGMFQDTMRYVVTVEQPDTTFALELKNTAFLCHVEVHQTEHAQLYIHIVRNGAYPFDHHELIPQNVDFSSYVNTKFVYVEKHMKRQLQGLYKDVLMQKCKLERLVLNNLLTTALVSEDEFAYAYMDQPGYTALVRGEVAHVIKCIPIPVRLVTTTRCYKEVPVSYRNKTLFLSPRNRLVQTTGTEVECHPLLPVEFSFGSQWYSVYPRPMRISSPNVITPTVVMSFKYESPNNLAVSGLYSYSDVEAYQRAVLFSGETNAMTSTFIRGYLGQQVDLTSGHLGNIIDENALETLSSKIMGKIWGLATGLGQVTSGLIGIFMLYKIILACLNIFMNAFGLYSTFGLSKHIFVCFWDSLTHYLISNTKMTKIPSIAKTSSEESPPCNNVADVSAGETTISMTPLLSHQSVSKNVRVNSRDVVSRSTLYPNLDYTI